MATVMPVSGRRGRWAELALLVPAVGVGVYAYLQVGLATAGAVSSVAKIASGSKRG